MKLRTIGMTAVAALALVAGSAQAQDAGWDTKYGILFTMPNPLGGASGRDVVNGYDGLVGFQYNLGNQVGIRVGANVLRKSCGDTEVTDSNNVTYKDPCFDIGSDLPPLPGATISAPGYNSEIGLDLQAEYLMRMTTAAVSPYVGVGASINFDRKSLSGTAEQSNLTGKTEYKDSEMTFGLGLLGKAGIEWRIHKVIALFAEYKADLPLVQRSSFKAEHKSTGSPTLQSDGNQTTWFNLTTGIDHGGLIGLVAFF